MPQLSRRQVLRAGMAAAVAGVGAGCASPAPAPSAPAAGAAPVRGGTLRTAFVGGGATDTLTLHASGTTLGFVRARAVHATLGEIDAAAPDGVRYGAVQTIEAAPDFSSYTLRLRPDVAFTDGSVLTARDVAYSLGLLAASPSGGYAPFVADFDLAGARVVDDTTLELPTTRPIADGREILCLGASFLVKEGTTAFTVDTASAGPFRLTAFEPGRGATLVRHDGWYGGGTLLDGLELLDIPDPAAQLAAVRGGQADYAFGLSPTVARTAESDRTVVVRTTGAPALNGLYFSMNMAQGPFTDPTLRRAVKLAVDRQALVDIALSGRGVVGQDLFAPGFPDSADSLPPQTYDPDQARSLVSAAGGAAVTLVTGPEAPGMVEVATAVAEQLGRVGITVTLDRKPAGQLFADLAGLAAAPMVGLFSTPTPPTLYYGVSFTAGNPFGFGWNRPDVDALVTTARTAADGGARRAAAVEAQRIFREDGNTLLPVLQPYLSVTTPRVGGLDGGTLEQYPGFVTAWLS